MQTNPRSSRRHNPWCVHSFRCLIALRGFEASLVLVCQLAAVVVGAHGLADDYGLNPLLPGVLLAFGFLFLDTILLQMLWGQRSEKFQIPLLFVAVLALVILFTGLFSGDFLRALGLLR